MKFLSLTLPIALLIGTAFQLLSAQTPEINRPKQTDSASGQLVQNFLTTTGGPASHLAIKNIVAEGTITEAGKIREFSAIETADGRRKITYRWRVLGRPHESIEAFDGEQAWKQNIKPKLEEAQKWEDRSASYFKHQRWFIQPFVAPLSEDYVFQYQGKSKVNGRPAHLVVGYGIANERTWFYFDMEKFLLTRWGGIGQAAGQDIYLDHRAGSFRMVEGLLLPKSIDLLIQDGVYGKIEFDHIRTNQTLPADTFVAKIIESRLIQQVNR